MSSLGATVALGIPLTEQNVHKCDHIAYFWESDQEFRRAVGFLEAGLRGNDHCVVFGYEDANNRVLDVLREQAFDPKALISQRRLTVLSADSTGDRTLSVIGRTFEQAIENGAPIVRLLGNIGWNRPKWPDQVDLLAFEAKVTSACRLFPCVVVCMYDVRAISGTVLLRGGLETHPLTIRGNVTRVNPHYIDADTFLKRLESEREGSR